MTLRELLIEMTGIQTPEIMVRDGQSNQGRFMTLNQARLAAIDADLEQRQRDPDQELVAHVYELRNQLQAMREENRRLKSTLHLVTTGGSVD